MKKTRKLLSLLLVLCMFATFAPAAFAADSTVTVFASADGAGTKDEQEVDNVTVNAAAYAAGVEAGASNGGEAIVLANGDVSATSAGGNITHAVAAEASAIQEGTAEATVSGNATASSTGVERANAYGTAVHANDGSTVTVTVSGDATATSAAGDYAYATGALTYAADGGTGTTAVTGDATATSTAGDYASATAALAEAFNGGTATATVTGNASATSTGSATAVNAMAYSGSTATATVSGDASATGTGDAFAEAVLALATSNDGEPASSAEANVSGNVTASVENGGASGAVARASGNGTSASAVIEGDITASSGADVTYVEGLTTYAYGSGASAAASVTGNVAATGGYTAQAVTASAYGGAKATDEIGGNVTAADAKTACGVSVSAGSESTAEVTIDGNIEVSGSAYDSSGATVHTDSTGCAKLEVTGDITSDKNGIVISTWSDESGATGSVDILVEGTVKGGKNSILAASTEGADSVTLAVWKAEVNESGKVVGITDLSEMKEYYKNDPEELAWIEEYEKDLTENAEKIEQNILYIIKYEDPENGTIKLHGKLESVGDDLKAAKEGDIVRLSALVKDGYTLVGAFNGTDTKTSLMRDANGNFFIVVPKGGGVYLTVKLEKFSGYSEVYAGPAAIGTRQLKGGAWLYLFADNTYKICFPDSKTEKGTYEIKDGKLLFTNKEGTTFEPTTNEDGNFEYTYVRKDGKEFAFTLSKSFTGRSIKAAEKV